MVKKTYAFKSGVDVTTRSVITLDLSRHNVFVKMIIIKFTKKSSFYLDNS